MRGLRYPLELGQGSLDEIGTWIRSWELAGRFDMGNMSSPIGKPLADYTWLGRGRVRPIVNIYVGFPAIIVACRLSGVGNSAVVQYLLVLRAEDCYHLREHYYGVSCCCALPFEGRNARWHLRKRTVVRLMIRPKLWYNWRRAGFDHSRTIKRRGQRRAYFLSMNWADRKLSY